MITNVFEYLKYLIERYDMDEAKAVALSRELLFEESVENEGSNAFDIVDLDGEED